jgi:hypothetical protein
VERRLVLRRLLLIGTPLVLASFMVVHQLIDQLQQPGAFLVLHLILLPLFALMGVALWALLEGVGGAVAWAARVAAFVFLVGYVALDAISGIAASAILASGAPRGRRRLPGRCLPRGPRPSPPWWRSSLGACLCSWPPGRCTGPGGRSCCWWRALSGSTRTTAECGESSCLAASRWPRRGWSSFPVGFACAARRGLPLPSPSSQLYLQTSENTTLPLSVLSSYISWTTPKKGAEDGLREHPAIEEMAVEELPLAPL